MDFAGYDDWRLPTGSGDDYFGGSAGEMYDLYHVSGITESTPGDLTNVATGFDDWYWSESANGAGLKVAFNFNKGEQIQGDTGGYLSAWAVRDGVTPVSVVPEPTTMFLVGTGLLGLTGIGRKRAKK